jgi:hypothetical protein
MSLSGYSDTYASGPKVEKIYENDSFIGLRSCYMGYATTETYNLSLLRRRIDSYQTKKCLIDLDANNIYSEIFDSSLKFDLAKLTECAKAADSTSIYNDYKKLLPDCVFTYANDLQPHSTLLNNTGYCDVYQYKHANDNYEEFKIYTYDYDSYEFYDILENNANFTSKDLYTAVFFEQGPPVVKDFLKNINPSTSIVYSFSREIPLNCTNFDNYSIITGAIDGNLKTFLETYTIYISSTQFTNETLTNNLFNKICWSISPIQIGTIA